MARKIFYSFHYDNDVFRVQQIRNIGALEDNKPVKANQWETVIGLGANAIKLWIEDNMRTRSCVVVLIGQETAERKWVNYEIRKAWNDGLGLLGVYIHNLKCPRTGTCWMGNNPFDNFNIDGEPLSEIAPSFNPGSSTAYRDIRDNLEEWIEEAVEIRNSYN